MRDLVYLIQERKPCLKYSIYSLQIRVAGTIDENSRKIWGHRSGGDNSATRRMRW
jgi:hypothetical protein